MDVDKDADYHLRIAFEGRELLLDVRGPEGPKLRQHVAEVERAARRCGLRVKLVGNRRR